MLVKRLKYILLGAVIMLTAVSLAMIISIHQQVEAEAKIKSSLAIGAKFPDFSVQDLAGQPLSIATGKGKLVLINFWATWCAPCVAELPTLEKVYAKYHHQGFDIIGVNVDRNKDKLTDFLKAQALPWPEYFQDHGPAESRIISLGLPSDNELAAKCGVGGVPCNFLLDHNGTILGVDLREDEFETAVAHALARLDETK